MIRRATAVGVALAIAGVVDGCAITGERLVAPEDRPAPVAPGDALAGGPTLVVDVTNASRDDHTVAYEFEGGATSGGGEGLAAPCERAVMPYGQIVGTYEISVDGVSLLDGRVPDVEIAAFVVSIAIDADGEATITGSRFAAAIPPGDARAVPCR